MPRQTENERVAEPGAAQTRGADEQRLMAEIEVMVRDIRRAIGRGLPPSEWRARRSEIDAVQLRLNELRARRRSY